MNKLQESPLAFYIQAVICNAAGMCRVSTEAQVFASFSYIYYSIIYSTIASLHISIIVVIAAAVILITIIVKKACWAPV